MLILDQIYQWTGFGDGQGLWTSQCRLRLYRPPRTEMIVIVSDLGSESGTSVTNCAAQLASKGHLEKLD